MQPVKLLARATRSILDHRDRDTRFGTDAAPLLKEESHALRSTLVSDFSGPFYSHRPRSRPTLAASDYPVYFGKIDDPYRTDKRFDRKEPYGCWRLPKMGNSRTRPCVFN